MLPGNQDSALLQMPQYNSAGLIGYRLVWGWGVVEDCDKRIGGTHQVELFHSVVGREVHMDI
jgi:hypothetical protein